jgi:hypothetical protein
MQLGRHQALEMRRNRFKKVNLTDLDKSMQKMYQQIQQERSL